MAENRLSFADKPKHLIEVKAWRKIEGVNVSEISGEIGFSKPQTLHRMLLMVQAPPGTRRIWRGWWLILGVHLITWYWASTLELTFGNSKSRLSAATSVLVVTV